MDGDERRASKRRSLEAGREILARYKASQGRMDNQTTDPSDGEELIGHNETIDTQNSSILEDTSCKDTTQSSISISEGEGEADIENMAGRVAELKELLQGKEAMIESLSAEIDHMRAEACSPNSSQSQSSILYRDLLTTYQHKLQDFEQAVAQRDNLITELTTSLEQALASRDALKDQVQFLNSLPILNHSSKDTNDLTTFQDSLNSTNPNHILEETIKQLNSKLQTLETEKFQEVKSYKSKINELNQRIEALELESSANLEERQKVQEAYDTQIQKIRKDMEKILDKFASETKMNSEVHHQELTNLTKAHESDLQSLKTSYEDQYKHLQEHYTQELSNLETKHAKELSVFQSQLSSYKKTIDSLKSQLENKSESNKNDLTTLKNQLLNAHHDRELLVEQIKLHKIQVDELTSKYVAATAVFDSKESIEKSLEEALTNITQLTQENDALKLKYDDLTAKYSAAQSLIENNQAHERSLSSKIFELERSIGRISGVNNSLFSEFNETTYQTFDELSLQVQLSRQKLEEKEALERKLTERIKSLEESVEKSSKELEQVTFEKNNYEKELKDLKNNFDKMRNSCSFSSDGKIEDLEKELEDMKDLMKKKDLRLRERDKEIQEIRMETQQLQDDCKKLMGGLQAAWNQCAEREQKLNESLINESKFGESFGINSSCLREDLVDNSSTSDETLNRSKPDAITSSLVGGINSAYNRYENLFIECEKLSEENNSLKRDYESLKLSFEGIKDEKDGLIGLIEKLKRKHEEEIGILKQQHVEEIEVLKKLFGDNGVDRFKEEMEKRHAEEMEELRTYFEEKVLHVEKQYSEEIFSQSKKLSDDSSEVGDMTDDLYFGGGGGDAEKFKDIGQVKEGLASEEKEKCGITHEQHCQTEMEPVDNGELSELRAAYSVQLEEQIALARCDIVNALQEQIQVLLAVEDDTEDNWPPELLQLRNKFTNNANKEMDKLKMSHQLEISKLKEEYSSTLENYQSEIKKLTQNRLNNQFNTHLSINDDIITQRNESLHKICLILKGLVIDLIKYTVTCEEELNNTFITEIIKQRIMSEEQNSSNEEINEKNQNISDNEIIETPKRKIIKRVHFAPQSREISSIMNSECDSLLDLIDEEENISDKLRNELGKCLERLRTESAEIIGASSTPGESTLDALSKQVLWTTKVNEELSAKLMEAEGIVEDYQMESQQLKIKIIDLQQKISIIEGAKEIISEGYGEQDDAGAEVVVQDFSQLLEKARLATVNAAADPAYHLQLIEELCRCTEKILEDSKREKEDLQQQIDAADKQLRSTRKFLEEQAGEREIERDEAAKNIKSLQEQLKERERDKERDLRISSESPSPAPDSSLGTSKRQLDCTAAVEVLESQLREMTSQISDTEVKRLKTESELEAAIEKIWELRDIIVDLEQQLQSKIDIESSLLSQNTQLKEIISSQTRNHQELAEELDELKSGGENTQLLSHISHLQNELQRHQLSTEHFTVNSSALKQMKSELREMQKHLDKRIKELEALHMTGSNLSISQPSEDVSIRDQIEASRCPTPDEDPNSPPTLPLDKLLKLKDKLMKHSRTEEVALKKIKDLDMQLSAMKIQNEELQEERDILQQTTSDQLFQIEQMRGRLEQYKQSAPFAQRQATSRLELELHEVNSKLQILEQRLGDKDSELREMKNQLDRANLLLKEKEEELNGVVHKEDHEIIGLKQQLEVLEHEKYILESKVSVQERAQQELPQLIDSMLADKNEEIDHLKDQLSKREKQLEALNSLQIEENKQIEPKNSARTLSDILSIHSECEEMSEAIRDTPNINYHPNVSSFRREHIQNQELQKSELMVPPLDLGTSPQTTPLHQCHTSPNIDSMMSGLDLKSPQSASDDNKSLNEPSTFSPPSQKTIQDLETKLKDIYEELKSKSSTLNKREMELNDLKKSLEELRAESKDSIEALTRDKDFYKNQYELSQESEKKIRRDLEEVENYLKVKSEELEVYREKIQLNEKILTESKNDNVKLKKEITTLQENIKNYEEKLSEKIEEFDNLNQIIFEKDITIETLKTRNMEIEDENKKLYVFKTKFEAVRKDVMGNNSEIKRLSDGINSRDLVIQRLEEMVRRSSLSSPDDVNKNQEIHHLKDLVKEKDKLIQQMTDDSKSLHRELENVHKKMKEPGNVVELRKKLQQEKKYNSELTKRVTKLSKELEVFKEDSRHPEVTDLEDMVQRELNLSADLDKKIMDAIESETDDLSLRKIEMHSCNSLTIKPVEQDLEKIMEQYLDIRSKLKAQNKLNNELKRQKNELEIEQEILRSQVSEYESRILQLKSDYENECQRNYNLSEELSSKKAAVRNLEVQVKKEKSAHQNCQIEDSNMIEMLRIKLTSCLTTEQLLKDNNANLRDKNKLLSCQLAALKHQIEFKAGVIPQEIPAPDCPEVSESLEVLRENGELKSSLQTLEIERNKYKKEVEIAVEENEKLLSSLAMVEGDKDHLEIIQKRLKETIKTREEEIEWLQRKIKVLTDADDKRQQQRSEDEHELKNLRQEIKNVREVMHDWQIDTDQMRQQLRCSLDERGQLSQVIVGLRKTEKELNERLSGAKKQEEILQEVINDLQGQLRVQRSLQGRGDEVDGQLAQSISELCGKLERYAHEKSILSDKLVKERTEKEMLGARLRELELMDMQRNCEDSDMSGKLQRLYGKYIRVDSKRKALAFQKRYLLCVIGGYQMSEENTLSVLAQLTNSERCYAGFESRKGKIRFRSAVLAVISMVRMKWLVVRWRQGVRRNAGKVVVEGGEKNFVGIQRGIEHSPPVREKRAHNGAGLEHYLERISNIQETLGLAMGEIDKGTG